MSTKQQQVKQTFAYKWQKRDTYESPAFQKKTRAWLIEKYCHGIKEHQEFLQNHVRGKSILDAGCGGGHSGLLFFGDALDSTHYTGVDISEATHIAKERFSAQGYQGQFIQNDLSTMQLNQNYDVIFSEGVIHHTSDPQKTFKNLVSHLKPSGTLMFYVYRKKAPTREFTDDFIRNQLKNLTDEKAWQTLMPLTKLGKALGDANTTITIDEDIDILKISKGTYTIQRLFYWFVAKAYHDPDFSLEEMNHINFDWYRPELCFRFEESEIQSWLDEAGLTATRFHTEPAGMTVVCGFAKKAS